MKKPEKCTNHSIDRIKKPLGWSLLIPAISQQYERKKPMTLIVGIVRRDWIVLAAESQYTDVRTGAVDNGDKISVVPLYFGEFLVAQAGLPDITSSIVDIMREKAKDIRKVNSVTIKQIASDSIHELKTKFLDEEQKKYCDENGGAALMLAFYAESEGKLHINKINVFGSGLTMPPENAHFAVCGAGQWLADYLLSEFYDPQGDENVAIGTAIYVLKKVKDHLRGSCGGRTNVRLMGRLSQPGLECSYIGKSTSLDPNFVDLLEKDLIEQDFQNKTARREQVISMMHDIGNRVMKARKEHAGSELRPVTS